MTEKYGIQATIAESLAQTPVTTDTEVVFIGAARCLTGSSQLTNAPYLKAVRCDSIKDFEEKFGVTSGTHLGLCDSAIAAFNYANIDHAWFININNPNPLKTQQAEKNITHDDIKAGLDVLDDVFMLHGVVPNIVCIPWCGLHSEAEDEGALDLDGLLNYAKSTCTNIADKFKAQLIYDVTMDGEQVDVDTNRPVMDNIDAELRDECAIAVWGAPVTSVATDGSVANYISGAAYVAALRALQDSKNEGRLPSRSIGNIQANAVKGVCIRQGYSPEVSGLIKIKNSDANTIQEAGIITWLNVGQNTFVTWGDHTTAFNTTVADERARFDSGIAMAYHLANRFILKWRKSIDDGFTLNLRNDIISEENDYLAWCVAAGALIGTPRCEFRAIDNTTDTIAQGQFYFTNIYTHVIPAKYIELKVQYTDEGLAVYNT